MIREAIKEQKRLFKHTNKELAEHCGCSIPTISNFLAGNKGIKYDYLVKLLKLYNLRLIKLI